MLNTIATAIETIKANPDSKAVVVTRTGRNIGNAFMSRQLASIAIVRADGRKINRDNTPYWISNTGTFASHYRTGMNRQDAANFLSQVADLQAEASTINESAK